MNSSNTNNPCQVKQTFNLNDQPSLLPKIPKVLSMSKKKQQTLVQNLAKASPKIHIQQKSAHRLSKSNNANTPQNFTQSSYTRINRSTNQKLIQKQKTENFSLSDQKSSLSHSGESNSVQNYSNMIFEKLDSKNYYQKITNNNKDAYQKQQNFLTSVNSNQFSNQKHPNTSFSNQKFVSQQTFYQRPTKSKQIKRQITRSASVDMNNSQVNESKNKQYLLQNKFYQYCTDQIVKISLQNQALKINLAKKEQIVYNLTFKNKQMELLNKKLQNQAQISKKQQIIIQKQKKILRKQIDQYQQKIQNVPQIYKTEYKERLKQFKTILKQKQQTIDKQKKQIESLLNQIKQTKNKNYQMERTKQQNIKLQSQIAKIKKKQSQYDHKVYRKNHVINHLQQVKNVQFQNLFDILQEMK